MTSPTTRQRIPFPDTRGRWIGLVAFLGGALFAPVIWLLIVMVMI
jgi:hypothetical protein